MHNILEAPGFQPSGHPTLDTYHNFKNIMMSPNLVEHFLATGAKIKMNAKAPRHTQFEYPEHQGAGIFPSTKGAMAGTGTGVTEYREFKPSDGLADAIALADHQDLVRSMPHQWVRPEHTQYTDRTDENMRTYFENVANDLQRQKIESMHEKGFSDEEIKKQLDKIRERDIEKAYNDPSNPAAIMNATIARSLPDYLQPDYAVKVSPGDVPLIKDASSYQLATMTMTPVQRNKRRMAKYDRAMESATMLRQNKYMNTLSREAQAADNRDEEYATQEAAVTVPTVGRVQDMVNKLFGGKVENEPMTAAAFPSIPAPHYKNQTRKVRLQIEEPD